MKKIPTPVLLTIVTIVDCIWGTKGFVTLCLWFLYGIHYYNKHFWD